MRHVFFFCACSLLALGPALAQAPVQASLEPAIPPTDLPALVKAAGLNPTLAESIVAVAIEGEPENAAEIAGDIVAALPPGSLALFGGRVAASAARAAPSHAAAIAGAATEAAAYSAGRTVQSRPGTAISVSTQATLTAAATAAVLEVQAVLVAVDQNPDPPAAAQIAGTITEAGVAGAMRGTSAAMWDVARHAGAGADEATTLGDEAARLAAVTVARGAIQAALLAESDAAGSDMGQAHALAEAAPDAAAQRSAVAVLAIASGVTKAAVAASLSLAQDQKIGAPILVASNITDAAVAETEQATTSAAANAAIQAGAPSADAARLGNAAAEPVSDQIGQVAAEATLTALAAWPRADIITAAQARGMGPTLANAIATVSAAQQVQQ